MLNLFKRPAMVIRIKPSKTPDPRYSLQIVDRKGEPVAMAFGSWGTLREAVAGADALGKSIVQNSNVRVLIDAQS